MPGFFDFLGSAATDLFGGGGDNSNPFGGVDPNAFGNFDPTNLFGGGDPNAFANVDPNNLFGGIDPNTFTNGIDPNNLFGGDPGGTPIPVLTAPTTPQAAGLANTAPPITGLTSPGGSGNPFQLPPTLMQLLTGIAGGGPGGGAAVTPTGPLGTTSPGSATPSGPSTSPANTGPAAGGGSGTPTNPLNNLFGSGLSLAQLLGAGGLGATLLNGPGTPPGSDQLSALAQSNQDLLNNQILPTALANQQGQINGTAMTQFEQDLARKQASIRQSYAGMGESGSTMEAQDLNGARDATTQAIFTSAQQMASTGLQYAGQLQNIDTGIYNDLMQANIAQDKEYRDALAAFAAAAAGTTQPAANATTVAGG